MNIYYTKNTCAKQITFEVTANNTLKNVRFINGCSGNLQGIAKLAEGRDIDEVITQLSGIKCRANTSCPDQLAVALKEYKVKTAQKKAIV